MFWLSEASQVCEPLTVDCSGCVGQGRGPGEGQERGEGGGGGGGRRVRNRFLQIKRQGERTPGQSKMLKVH